MTIQARELRKCYGPVVAVDGLSFVARAGEVTGFVGPNGAGKSTTMRMLLGLDATDGGEALIGGRRYRTLREPARAVGALLDAEAVHPGRSGYHHLLWMAQYNGIGRRRVREVLDLVGLGAAGGQRVGGYSMGMRQRLGIAGAILGDPPVLILDEPVNGLDPEGIRWIRGFLRSMAGEGRTVLVSSHLMSELEDTADHLLVVGRGRLLADAPVERLLAEASSGQVTVRTTARAEAVEVLANAGATVTVGRPGTLTVGGLEAEQVAAALAGAGLPFSEIGRHRATLEEVYLDLTRFEGLEST